jgi:hypothetical protein
LDFEFSEFFAFLAGLEMGSVAIFFFMYMGLYHAKIFKQCIYQVRGANQMDADPQLVPLEPIISPTLAPNIFYAVSN